MTLAGMFALGFVCGAGLLFGFTVRRDARHLDKSRLTQLRTVLARPPQREP